MTFVMGTDYIQITCGGKESGGCDMPFAMTKEFYDLTKRTGQTWYCPRGHARAWAGETTEVKLQNAEARLLQTGDQLRAAIREGELHRQEVLRIRSRVANGVCPCCNRMFEKVRLHMHAKHPEYAFDYHVPPMKKFECGCGRSFESFRGLRQHQGKSRVEGVWDKPSTAEWHKHLSVV